MGLHPCVAVIAKGGAAVNEDDNPISKAHMRPPDARQRPSEWASGARATPSKGAASVAFMARAVGSKTTLQAMKDWHTLKPELFRKPPYTNGPLK